MSYAQRALMISYVFRKEQTSNELVATYAADFFVQRVINPGKNVRLWNVTCRVSGDEQLHRKLKCIVRGNETERVSRG
jgi:hypothetical protein